MSGAGASRIRSPLMWAPAPRRAVAISPAPARTSTTPSSSPRCASATSIAKRGLSVAKLWVPSIGSMTQTGASPSRAASTVGSAATASSPTVTEPGTTASRATVRAASAARSATVTRSPGAFSTMSVAVSRPEPWLDFALGDGADDPFDLVGVPGIDHDQGSHPGTTPLRTHAHDCPAIMAVER